MDKTVQVCVNCDTSLAIGLKLHFCPYCGTPQLEKKLLDTRSTQNYDPGNPRFKPWRDKPTVPKRVYKVVDASAKRPWCPAMRQANLRPKKSAPPAPNEIEVPTVSGDMGTSSALPTEIDIDHEGVDVVETEDGHATTPEDIPPEPFLGLYTEITSPVAVYAAENWMAVGGMSVNISLIEQTLGDFHHAYWLRIGVMFDDDTPRPKINKTEVDEKLTEEEWKTVASDNPENCVAGTPPLSPIVTPFNSNSEPEENDDQQLYTVTVLSSEVGKLMVPRADDWVDLCAVDPTEYYMARHMERVLESLAHRVVTTNLNELALRQTYHVTLRRRTKQTKLADALHSVGGGLSTAAVERLSLMHTSSAAWGYNATQIVCQLVGNPSAGAPTSAKESPLMSRTSTSISVCFQDWVVQLAHRLVLTRGISVRHYPSLVRVSFRYENRLQDPKQFPGYSQDPSPATSGRQFENSTGNRSGKSSPLIEAAEEDEQQQADVSGKYIDPRLTERHKKIQFFAASQRITHAVLSITPGAVHITEVVPPAELSFDVASLNHLLRDHAPKNIDEMVREGKPSVLFQFATRLVRLVRLECTNNGLKYAVVGAFSEPPHETCGWPLDVPSYLDNDLDDLLVNEEPEDTPDVLGSEGEPALEMGEPKETEVEPEPIVEEYQPPPPVLDEVADIFEAAASPRATTPPSPSPRVESAPSPFVEPCPMHPILCTTASADETCGCCVNMRSCKCAHQVVTLKGSEIRLWANFSLLKEASSQCQPGAEALEKVDLTAATGVAGAVDTATVSLSSTIEAADFMAISKSAGYTIQVANALRLVAVDQIDPSLTCEIGLSPDRVTEILRQTCTAANSTEAAPQKEDFASEDVTVEGKMRQYTVSSNDMVHIDLMQHPALRRLCFDYICDSSMLDLFLSRKSRLIKLIVK